MGKPLMVEYIGTDSIFFPSPVSANQRPSYVSPSTSMKGAAAPRTRTRYFSAFNLVYSILGAAFFCASATTKSLFTLDSFTPSNQVTAGPLDELCTQPAPSAGLILVMPPGTSKEQRYFFQTESLDCIPGQAISGTHCPVFAWYPSILATDQFALRYFTLVSKV